jgi:hypothetical protein
MTRSHRTARQAGTSFETWLVEYWREAFGTRAIERRARKGARDEGDIAGLNSHAGPICVEAKNHNRLDLAGWIQEAQIEAGHADAAMGVVVHKRRGFGRGQMGEQYVTLRLADFTILLGGQPGPHIDPDAAAYNSTAQLGGD